MTNIEREKLITLVQQLLNTANKECGTKEAIAYSQGVKHTAILLRNTLFNMNIAQSEQA